VASLWENYRNAVDRQIPFDLNQRWLIADSDSAVAFGQQETGFRCKRMWRLVTSVKRRDAKLWRKNSDCFMSA